jgi:biopolymer transport protein ExbB
MLNDVRAFLDIGGFAMGALMLLCFGMWALLLDRISFLLFTAPDEARETLAAWESREEHNSWYALQIRRMLLSEYRQRLTWSFPLIKAAVAVCPMIGLLGTVTGMIDIFASMSIESGENARAMASGVSKAMSTTMAGMVAALSGMLAQATIVRASTHRLVDFECKLDHAVESRPVAS